MGRNLMLIDISNEFHIAHKGCTFQVDTWGLYIGWSQCLRDLVTNLETPQFLQPMLIISQPLRSYRSPPPQYAVFPQDSPRLVESCSIENC